ncbi:MAG: hypothetical protein ACP5G2_04125 [Candidatus Bipolaricaulaceae bacterium]
MRALVAAAVLGALSFTGTGAWMYADAFWCSDPGRGGWSTVGPNDYARWEFSSLPGSGEHVQVELMVKVPSGQPRSLTLLASTPATTDWRPYAVAMQLVQDGGDGPYYFGQLQLARRDLRLGSQLSLRLWGPGWGAIALREDSLRLRLDGAWTTQTLGPFAMVWSAPYTAQWPAIGAQAGDRPTAIAPANPLPAPPSLELHRLPETESAAEAQLLSPGTYQGEIGWAGPNNEPDGYDFYQLNLQPGQNIRVTVRTDGGGLCGLDLFDPHGSWVAQLAPTTSLGLGFCADARGRWTICIRAQDCGQLVRYTLSVDISPTS